MCTIGRCGLVVKCFVFHARVSEFVSQWDTYIYIYIFFLQFFTCYIWRPTSYSQLDVIRLCSPLGASLFSAYRYDEWRIKLTDFNVVSYGYTSKFKVLFSMIPAPVPNLCCQGHGLLKKGDSSGRGYEFSQSAWNSWQFIKFIENFQLCYMCLLKYMYMTVVFRFNIHWTIFQLFSRHCFQICGSFTQHWDECHPKPCRRWNFYNSSTQARDCPSCRIHPTN